MMKGEIPEDVRPWVCGASLVALRKSEREVVGFFQRGNRPIDVPENQFAVFSVGCIGILQQLVGSLHGVDERI